MRRAIYEDDVIKLLDKGWKSGVYPAASNIHALPSAQPEHALKDCRNCKYGKYNDHWDTYFCYNSDNCEDWNLWESDIIPSAQPDEKLRKIADLVEGSIDHFDRDDAMDLLYKIKDVVR